jgi:hypothetical protein
MTEEVHEVQTVSGEILRVQSAAESRWYADSRDSYLAQTKFTETTDLRDQDRLLVQELLVFRLSQFLAAGHDYDGFDIDETLLRRNVREYSEQITRLKESMSLTKRARDDAASGGDVNAYIQQLKQKAKIFGVHREKQLTKALVLMNELKAIVGAYDRSDAEERHRLGFENELVILDWIRNTMIPEYDELDAHFRETDQKYWVRTM